MSPSAWSAEQPGVFTESRGVAELGGVGALAWGFPLGFSGPPLCWQKMCGASGVLRPDLRSTGVTHTSRQAVEQLGLWSTPSERQREASM